MGRLFGVLGKGILAALLVIVAVGLFLAFTTMGPGRQTPAALAPTPAPAAVGTPPLGAFTPTPAPLTKAAPTPTVTSPSQLPPRPVPKSRPEDAPIRGGAIGEPLPTTDYRWLVHEKDAIAIGIVREVLPPRWNTADGRRPPVYHNLPLDQQGRYVIYRPVVMQVERYIKAPTPPDGLITFAHPGGEVGQDSFTYTGDPQTPFAAGDRVLVFLRKQSMNALPEYPAEANPSFFNAGGKHAIAADGRARYREIDLPLEEVVRRVEEALRQR